MVDRFPVHKHEAGTVEQPMIMDRRNLDAVAAEPARKPVNFRRQNYRFSAAKRPAVSRHRFKGEHLRHKQKRSSSPAEDDGPNIRSRFHHGAYPIGGRMHASKNAAELLACSLE